MKSNRTTSFLVAAVLALAAAIVCLVPSVPAAARGAVSLIDKETEACVRKICSRRLYKLIDATDDQRAKLDDLAQSTADTTRPLREDLRSGILDLSKLFAEDQSTDEEITKKAHKLQSLQQTIAEERLSAMLKARHVLSKEQRQKIDQRITDIITAGLPRRLS
jgi:Spy/CpxP family protein refolding chaperone